MKVIVQDVKLNCPLYCVFWGCHHFYFKDLFILLYMLYLHIHLCPPLFFFLKRCFCMFCLQVCKGSMCVQCLCVKAACVCSACGSRKSQELYSQHLFLTTGVFKDSILYSPGQLPIGLCSLEFLILLPTLSLGSLRITFKSKQAGRVSQWVRALAEEVCPLRFVFGTHRVERTDFRKLFTALQTQMHRDGADGLGLGLKTKINKLVYWPRSITQLRRHRQNSWKFKAIWATRQDPISKKGQSSTQGWWCTPIIPSVRRQALPQKPNQEEGKKNRQTDRQQKKPNYNPHYTEFINYI